MLRYNRLTKYLCCISTKVCKLPYYNGLYDVNIFIDHF